MVSLKQYRSNEKRRLRRETLPCVRLFHFHFHFHGLLRWVYDLELEDTNVSDVSRRVSFYAVLVERKMKKHRVGDGAYGRWTTDHERWKRDDSPLSSLPSDPLSFSCVEAFSSSCNIAKREGARVDVFVDLSPLTELTVFVLHRHQLGSRICLLATREDGGEKTK